MGKFFLNYCEQESLRRNGVAITVNKRVRNAVFGCNLKNDRMILELDYKESWGPKNWCFGTVVLEKTLESPLDCKETKLFNPKGHRQHVGCSWVLCLWSAHRSLHLLMSWEPKNWWFWTAVLEKTLESPLDCKEIQPVHCEGDQPWVVSKRVQNAVLDCNLKSNRMISVCFQGKPFNITVIQVDRKSVV